VGFFRHFFADDTDERRRSLLIFAKRAGDDSSISGGPAPTPGFHKTKMIWTILGVSVAVVAVFCVAVAEMLVGHPIFEHNREYIAGALAACGIAAWFVGRAFARRAEKRRAVAGTEEDGARLFVLFDLRYWGPMLLTLGAITLFIQTIGFQKEKTVVAPPPPPPKKVEVVAAPEPEPPKPKAPVVFPTLHVQGIILNEGRPVAILNGHSYFVGDNVGDVTVKAISREGVELEKLGEVKLLSLR